MEGGVVWPPQADHSGGEQHSEPSQHPGGGRSGAAGHRQPAQWCPLYHRHEAPSAPELQCHPPIGMTCSVITSNSQHTQRTSFYLANHELVTVVVAGQVGENASCTGHHIDVITAEELNQSPEETLHPLLQWWSSQSRSRYQKFKKKASFQQVFESFMKKWDVPFIVLTCLVAASERFLRVQRQFWTRRWLGSVRWSPKACMPPTQANDLS